MRADRSLTLYAINEPVPGPRWQALFDAVWPAYRAWYLQDGEAARPSLEVARARLQRHMPELVPTWERLVALTGGDDLAARMLTQWDPPKFLPGCSQVAVTGPEPALLRNYDYSPDLFEAVTYSSAFTGRRVIGTGDCLWGLLDGMNEDGLAVSLAFGGRPGSAPGFAAPLVVRYLLEVAADVDQAKEVLRALPVSMAYNLTMVDAAGGSTTAYVAPGAEPEYSADAAATNHRGRRPEHPEHARRFRSVERQDVLCAAVAAGLDVDGLGRLMLERPLFSDDYDGAFGTLYTAIYRPVDHTVEYRWRGDAWTRTFSSPEETRTVVLQSRPADDAGADLPGVVPPSAGVADAGSERSGLDPEVAELGDAARAAIARLSTLPVQDAFAELLSLSAAVGEALGTSARTLAEHGSWAQVAGVAGVTRQAAWYRWKG